MLEPYGIMGALWPLALLIPFAPLLPRTAGLPWRQEFFMALLLVVTFAALTSQFWKHRSAFNLSRHDLALALPLLLFVIWSATSSLWALSLSPALHHTLVWGAYLLFFLLMRRAAASACTLRLSLIGLTLVVWVLGISCAVEYWGAPNDIAARTDSLFRYFNGFGEMMAACVPLFAALALRLRRTRVALLCGATAVLAWLAVFQALERAPIVGATFALLLLAAASTFTRRFRPRSLVRTLVLLAAFGAATALQFVPSPLNEGRISAASRLQATSAGEANTRVRFLFWGIGLEMWRGHKLAGVGANNFDVAFPGARAEFSARHADSDLIAMDEEMLVERVHNEYIQILAELGLVGFTLFLIFCASLVVAAWRALRHAESPLAIGSICSLAAFALSSGASSASFRWMGGGLVFFFAAALVSHFSAPREGAENAIFRLTPAFARAASLSALAFSLLMLFGRGAQATSAAFQEMTASAQDEEHVEKLFDKALAWNPLDAATHYNFGIWLYLERRASEAVPHLRFAVERGFNASVCYAYLAAAEAGAGDLPAAEETLGRAARVYPRSVFLRVRHASALAEIGRGNEAADEYRAALALNSRMARGWRQLISFGRKAAKAAAFYDKGVAQAGELAPENCIFAVLDENERRTPVAHLEESPSLKASANQTKE
ncbi:MAG TPA: O-antigen ligase family protein [Pyrinomonadaceae bacterium]|nr:O-antigen ligase family protein [Pyrinomonadaceae bacterium]